MSASGRSAARSASTSSPSSPSSSPTSSSARRSPPPASSAASSSSPASPSRRPPVAARRTAKAASERLFSATTLHLLLSGSSTFYITFLSNRAEEQFFHLTWKIDGVFSISVGKKSLTFDSGIGRFTPMTASSSCPPRTSSAPSSRAVRRWTHSRARPSAGRT